MPLSQATVIRKVRDVLAEIPSFVAVYDCASAEPYRALPAALTEFPCAVVLTGPTISYQLSAGQQRHTYQVLVQVMVAGPSIGLRSVVAAPLPDQVIEHLVGNVALGGVATYVRFVSCSGLSAMAYLADEPAYTGYQIVLEVSEQAEAAPAYGD